ncbi:MAG: NACHT domain-containing protein [Trebonia sp.]
MDADTVAVGCPGAEYWDAPSTTDRHRKQLLRTLLEEVNITVRRGDADPHAGLILRWKEWLAGHLAVRFGIRKQTAARLVRDRRILPLVDGLDEMDPARTSQPQRARALVGALNEAMSGPERAPVVVTCRRGEYNALGHGINRATHVEMTGLDGNKAAAYLLGQLTTTAEENRWKPVLASLDKEPYGLLAGQMATPWRLTLALAAFRDEGDPSALLPPAGSTDGEYTRYLDSLLLGSYAPCACTRPARPTPNRRSASG